MPDNRPRISPVSLSPSLAVVATLCLAVAVAGAAGTTTVRLTAPDGVGVSETTTVGVVVVDADDGVGAYNVTVAVTDPSVARISDVELEGDPPEETRRVRLAPDGSAATMVAALANTSDTGRVTIATVQLRGVSPGSTILSLSVPALGDERGQPYATETGGTNLTVVDTRTTTEGDATDSPRDGGSGTPASATESPTGIEPTTERTTTANPTRSMTTPTASRTVTRLTDTSSPFAGTIVGALQNPTVFVAGVVLIVVVLVLLRRALSVTS